MENGSFMMTYIDFLLVEMVIFHSHVKLNERRVTAPPKPAAKKVWMRLSMSTLQLLRLGTRN